MNNKEDLKKYIETILDDNNKDDDVIVNRDDYKDVYDYLTGCLESKYIDEINAMHHNNYMQLLFILENAAMAFYLSINNMNVLDKENITMLNLLFDNYKNYFRLNDDNGDQENTPN